MQISWRERVLWPWITFYDRGWHGKCKSFTLPALLRKLLSLYHACKWFDTLTLDSEISNLRMFIYISAWISLSFKFLNSQSYRVFFVKTIEYQIFLKFSMVEIRQKKWIQLRGPRRSSIIVIATWATTFPESSFWFLLPSAKWQHFPP